MDGRERRRRSPRAGCDRTARGAFGRADAQGGTVAEGIRHRRQPGAGGVRPVECCGSTGIHHISCAVAEAGARRRGDIRGKTPVVAAGRALRYPGSQRHRARDASNGEMAPGRGRPRPHRNCVRCECVGRICRCIPERAQTADEPRSLADGVPSGRRVCRKRQMQRDGPRGAKGPLQVGQHRLHRAERRQSVSHRARECRSNVGTGVRVAVAGAPEGCDEEPAGGIANIGCVR